MDELLLYREFRNLSLLFPDLKLLKDGDNPYRIHGQLSFSEEFQVVRITDEYIVEITIPDTYPVEYPRVQEIGGRIPKSFHHYQNNILCLGAPIAVKQKFWGEPTLVGFIRNCLIPYLYSFSYNSQYGVMPFGELSHGGEGILEYYQDVFNLNGYSAPLELIKILAEQNYRGHILCPCGSGKRLRNCHGGKLLEIKDLQSPSDFEHDFTYILQALKERRKK